MKIIKVDTISGSTDYVNITLIPRKPVLETDTLIMNIRDEINDVSKTVIDVFFEQINEYLYLSIDNTDDYFKPNHKFYFNLMVGSVKYFEGKIVCINIDDSIQDYKNAIITNNKLKF